MSNSDIKPAQFFLDRKSARIVVVSKSSPERVAFRYFSTGKGHSYTAPEFRRCFIPMARVR